MFFTIFLLTITIVAISLLALGVQTFFSKKKKFPETRVGHNRNLRKKKIYCMKTQQVVIDKDAYGKKNNKISCDAC